MTVIDDVVDEQLEDEPEAHYDHAEDELEEFVQVDEGTLLVVRRPCFTPR